MATTKSILANPIRNKGATVFMAGAIPTGSTLVTNPLGIGSLGYHSGKAGSVVPNNVAAGVYPVNNAARFAGMAAGKYIAMKQSTEIAGIASSLLLFAGAAPVRNSINRIENIKTSKVTAWSWATNSEGGARVTFTYTNNDLAFGNDDAARPSRAIPGELSYIKDGKTVTNDDYKAKTN